VNAGGVEENPRSLNYFQIVVDISAERGQSALSFNSNTERDVMAERAKKGIQVTVEEDVSTVIIGGSKVEIGAEGKNVTAYASDGVEIKSVSGEAAANGTQFSVSEDFNTVVLNGVTIERAADGHLVISRGRHCNYQTCPGERCRAPCSEAR
jgi:hypothetical protein